MIMNGSVRFILVLKVASNCGSQSGRQRAEEISTVARSEQVFASTFRMRHQAEHVTLAVAYAGDVIARPVWVRSFSDGPVLLAVTKHDAIFALEFRERFVVA